MYYYKLRPAFGHVATTAHFGEDDGRKIKVRAAPRAGLQSALVNLPCSLRCYLDILNNVTGYDAPNSQNISEFVISGLTIK